MKIQEYRDLIDECWQVRTSLMLAATSHERRVKAGKLQKVVADLAGATCPRSAKLDDVSRAMKVVRACQELLELCFREFKSADAALAKMAFGEEWR